jgi:hypothetical protein
MPTLYISRLLQIGFGIDAKLRANVDLSLEECYRLYGIPDTVAKVEKASKRGITPPGSPLKKGSKEQKTTITPKRSPPKPSTFPPSELSDCPTDLSDWDESKPVSNHPKLVKCFPLLFPHPPTNNIQHSKAGTAPTRADSAQQEEVEETVIEESKQKPTTRGVAQKVKKAAKKPAPGVSKETAPSRVVALDLGSSMKGSRRRSSRLGNAQDK